MKLRIFFHFDCLAVKRRGDMGKGNEAKTIKEKKKEEET